MWSCDAGILWPHQQEVAHFLVVECILSDVDLRIGDRSERRMSCSKDFKLLHYCSTTVSLHPRILGLVDSREMVSGLPFC